MAIVYQHRRLDTNEVFYIGIGKDEKRAVDKRSRNKYWKHIVNKYGYQIDILINGCSWEQACEVEIGLINSYGRKDLEKGTLVNMTDGGDGINGYIYTEEHKEKMSVSAKNRKPISEETRKKLSDTRKGKKRKPFTEEHKQKMSDVKKGIVRKSHTQESKQKMSISNIGKPRSEETKQKMKEAWIIRKQNKLI